MVQAGKNISVAGDELQKVQVEYLFHAIRNPNMDIQNKIRQLRIVRNIDSKQYAFLKRQLPYFVCGLFNPNIRRTENFAYTQYFVVDIDHLSDKGIAIKELRTKLESDDRVCLSFISPSEDGLKIMFKLEERCYDPGLYSLFYKCFTTDFSKKYGLEQVTDSRTSDVTRACFISYDPEVYYNPNATSVNLEAYVDSSNPNELFEAKKRFESAENEEKRTKSEEKERKEDVDSDVINQIKTILNNSPKKIEKPPVYVPEQLNEIIEDLTNFIISTGTIVQEITNISYGKKIKVAVGHRLGEINLFYGKKGFTVVKSARTGTSPEINDMIAGLIESFLFTL